MSRIASTPAAAHRAIALFIGAAMLLAWSAPQLFRDEAARSTILLVAIGVASIPLFIEMLRQLLRRNFSVDLLAMLAIGSAVAFREYWVAAIVILMLSGGRFLEEYAIHRASSVLSALARRMPNIAHRVESSGQISDISIDAISIGERLAVYPHELCPVDGVVVEGNGSMDESYLTGEPYQISKAPGSSVLSGAINGEAALRIQATRRAVDSRYAKIVEILHASEEDRPRIRRIGERLGAWYTPAAITIAILSWAASGDPDRFLAVLVIATPCPLILAIPVAIIGAVTMAARAGIIVKDPTILERLPSCKTLIVDKTGTLTHGRPSLTEIICIANTSRRTVLQLAASLEQYSKHPLAPAVISAAREESIPMLVPDDVFEFPGQGLRAHLDGHIVQITGRSKLSAQAVKQLGDVAPGLECVVLLDGAPAGLFRFRDEPRSESKPFLQHVHSRHGILKTVLLSGDRPQEVASFADRMGIKQQYGGRSPEQKIAIVRELSAEEPTLYIGDGINDAPAMMNATAGVALGVNSDITSEAAGAVILESSLRRVDELIHISTYMRKIALTSAIGGMLLSAAGMAAAGLGFLTPVQGAILQEVIDLLAITNSLRMVLPAHSMGDFVTPKGPEKPTQLAPSRPLTLHS